MRYKKKCKREKIQICLRKVEISINCTEITKKGDKMQNLYHRILSDVNQISTKPWLVYKTIRKKKRREWIKFRALIVVNDQTNVLPLIGRYMALGRCGGRARVGRRTTERPWRCLFSEQTPRVSRRSAGGRAQGRRQDEKRPWAARS